MNSLEEPTIISDEETFFGLKDVIEIKNNRRHADLS
jgi:hypothetical protein